MSKALELEVTGRTRRRVGLGQSSSDLITGATDSGVPVATPDPGILGLPVIAWIGLGLGLIVLMKGKLF